MVVLVAGVLGAFFWLRSTGQTAPVAGQQRCVATSGSSSVALDLDQAKYASIIVGISVRRGLAPRAASIALATVYQETGLRNLDHGDRDSVGLFQQRPSQGWGTVKQLMDPYYSTGKFYDALVKIKGWETEDVNDVAQKVQRSGHPEAYRPHEADARTLASTLTGRSPGGFSCLERKGTRGDAAALVTSLERTFDTLSTSRDGRVVIVRAKTATLAWTYASYAVANSGSYGLVSAQVGARQWESQTLDLPDWSPASHATADTTVTLTLR